MSTITDPLTQGINALTAYCNQIDGGSDTNLSDAVYSLAQGYGGSGYTIDDIAEGALNELDDITINTTAVAETAFSYFKATTIRMPNVTELSNGRPFISASVKYIDIPECIRITDAFYGCSSLVATVGDEDAKILRLKKIKTLGMYAFYAAKPLKVYFYQSEDMNLNKNAFYNNTTTTDVYVPWSEGDVANAPWGMKNATIHYDTVYDDNGDPIT